MENDMNEFSVSSTAFVVPRLPLPSTASRVAGWSPPALSSGSRLPASRRPDHCVPHGEFIETIRTAIAFHNPINENPPGERQCFKK